MERTARIGSIALVLALALSGCAPAAPTPEQVAEQEQLAAETEAERAEQQANLERLTSATWQEFSAEPAELKRSYAVQAVLNRETDHQMMMGDEGTQMPTALDYPLDGEGEMADLDGQAILNNWNYTIEDARIIAAEDGSLDIDEAIKTLSAAFYVTDESGGASQAYIEERDDLLSHAKPFKYTDTRLTVFSETPIADGVDNAGTPIRFKDVSYTDEGGTSYVARFAYIETERIVYEGYEAEYWVLIDRQAA